MFFDCIVKGAEQIQYWMEIFVWQIQQHPATSYLVVTVVVVNVLIFYRHQLILNSDLFPRGEDQAYHSPIKNYGHSETQSLIPNSNYYTQQPYSIKSKNYVSQPKKVGRSIYPQIDETIHPSGAKKKQKKTAADFKYPNVAFYSNQIPSEPNGDYIDNILTLWKGNYEKLEAHHGYIQWLFPNKDMGVNKQAHPLTDEEAKIIRTTPELKEKVKASFEMMLDFFGMELTKENTVVLADNRTKRLQELNQWGNHNFLRISRILLALKLLGHSNLMLPWMKLFVDLIYVEKVLDHAKASFEDFWENNLDAKDKIDLDEYKNSVK